MYPSDSPPPYLSQLHWKGLHNATISGIFIRLPDPDNDPLIAVYNGYEINLLSQQNGNTVHEVEAIYGFTT
jgi:hypothetical protein